MCTLEQIIKTETQITLIGMQLKFQREFKKAEQNRVILRSFVLPNIEIFLDSFDQHLKKMHQNPKPIIPPQIAKPIFQEKNIFSQNIFSTDAFLNVGPINLSNEEKSFKLSNCISQLKPQTHNEIQLENVKTDQLINYLNDMDCEELLASKCSSVPDPNWHIPPKKSISITIKAAQETKKEPEQLQVPQDSWMRDASVNYKRSSLRSNGSSKNYAHELKWANEPPLLASQMKVQIGLLKEAFGGVNKEEEKQVGKRRLFCDGKPIPAWAQDMNLVRQKHREQIGVINPQQVFGRFRIDYLSMNDKQFFYNSRNHRRGSSQYWESDLKQIEEAKNAGEIDKIYLKSKDKEYLSKLDELSQCQAENASKMKEYLLLKGQSHQNQVQQNIISIIQQVKYSLTTILICQKYCKQNSSNR